MDGGEHEMVFFFLVLPFAALAHYIVIIFHFLGPRRGTR